MNVVFRTDASVQIGTGHLMRCLTLAENLSEKKANVLFICRDLSDDLTALVKKNNFKVHLLESDKQLLNNPHSGNPPYSHWLSVSQQQDAEDSATIINKTIDWLVVDHYALDKEWETKMRSSAHKILVIDDLADRQHDCDILLDQNLFTELNNRYTDLIPDTCKQLLGPDYVLLRQEFIITKTKLRHRTGEIKNILVFFGGTDKTNETLKAINAIKQINKPEIQVDVVVGSSNPHKDTIKTECETIPNMNFHCQVDNISSLMEKADITIGAGGTTSWERCYLGLPSLVATLANNQAEINATLDTLGAIVLLGEIEHVTSEEIAQHLRQCMMNPEQVVTMSETSKTIMKNHSGAKGVVDVMLKNNT